MKTPVLFLLVSLGAVLPAGAQLPTVKIGLFDHAPFVVSQGRAPDGGEIRYLNLLCKEMGLTPVYLVLPFPRMVSALENGEVDMALELLKTPERDGKMVFSEKPVVRYAPVLVVLGENPLNKITKIEDLTGYKIAYLIGSTVPEFFRTAPRTVSFDSNSGDDWLTRNLKRMKEKRVDAILVLNPYSPPWEAKKLGFMGQFKILGLPGNSEAFFAVFSPKSPRGTDLAKHFDAAVQKLGTTLEKETDLFVQQN